MANIDTEFDNIDMANIDTEFDESIIIVKSTYTNRNMSVLSCFTSFLGTREQIETKAKLNFFLNFP